MGRAALLVQSMLWGADGLLETFKIRNAPWVRSISTSTLSTWIENLWTCGSWIWLMLLLASTSCFHDLITHSHGPLSLLPDKRRARTFNLVLCLWYICFKPKSIWAYSSALRPWISRLFPQPKRPFTTPKKTQPFMYVPHMQICAFIQQSFCPLWAGLTASQKKWKQRCPMSGQNTSSGSGWPDTLFVQAEGCKGQRRITLAVPLSEIIWCSWYYWCPRAKWPVLTQLTSQCHEK